MELEEFSDDDEIDFHLKSSEELELPAFSNFDCDNLRPTKHSERTWSVWDLTSVWMGMAVSVTSYLLGAGLVASGLTFFQSIATIFLVLGAMYVASHPGTKWGVPYPVFVRSIFGIRGSKAASLVRALIGCGWFGIQTWVGGESLYFLLDAMFGDMENSPYLSDFIGINLMELFCYFLFFFFNVVVAYFISEKKIRHTEFVSVPILALGGIALLIWSFYQVPSISDIFKATTGERNITGISSFFKIFLPDVAAVLGFWGTVSMNIMDFTRFSKSQRDQALGQLFGLPTTTIFFAFVGVVVTSATIVLYGKPIWSPMQLVAHWDIGPITIVSMLLFIVATLSSNAASNLAGPSNDFSNIFPRKLHFVTSTSIVGALGTLFLPWKLLAEPTNFISGWLITTSYFTGSIMGPLVADYYILRHKHLIIEELYNPVGIYSFYYGFNWRAFLASGISLLPCVPGFFGVAFGISVPEAVKTMYSYSWLISFALSFGIHWGLTVWKPESHYNIMDRQEEDSLDYVDHAELNTSFELKRFDEDL